MLSKDQALELARDAYTSSTTFFNASLRNSIEQDMRQFQGLHPNGSKYYAEAYKGRSKLFRPKTRSSIRKNEAVAAEALFSTTDVINMAAMDDSDEVSRLAADILKPIMQRHMTTNVPWFLTSIGAYQEAQAVGVVVSYQYWEYDQAKGLDYPCIKLIPIENMRIDPAADWADPIKTSPYLIELLPMYVGDVKARMKTTDPKTGQAKWTTYSDAEIMSASKNYADSTRLLRDGQRMDSKEQPSNVNAYTVVWVHRNIVMHEGEDYMYYTLGHEKLLSAPKLVKDVYPQGRPYVMGICALETHKNYPGGVTRLTRDTQQEINEVTNQRLDNVKFAMNKRYFVQRDRQVDTRSLTRNVPGSVTMMKNVNEDVKVLETPDVTSSSYQEQDRLNLDFDDVSGSFSQASVSSNRKLNETVGGMNLVSTNANQISGYQLRTWLETWAEPVLNQVLTLIKYYETDDKMFRLSPEGRSFLDQGGDIAALLESPVSVKVSVGMGVTNPHDQVQNFMSGMDSLRNILADGTLEKYGLQVKEVTKEIFGKLGYSDGSRFFTPPNGQEDPQIAQLKNQLSQVQQALEAKHPKELTDAMVKKLIAEIEKIKAESVNKNVASAFAAIQTGEVIAAVPSTAPIADEVLKSAGFVASTVGQDPNLPQPAQADPGLGVQDVTNKRTGIGFTPGDDTQPSPDMGNPISQGAIPTNTDPMTPALPAQPGSPNVGAGQGIETMRPDSVR